MKEMPDMTIYEDPSYADATVTISNHLLEIDKRASIEAVLDGLTSDRKYISSKYFYDAEGSRLFEEITRLPEYYLTRTEKAILRDAAFRIAGDLGNIDIIEIGSGDGDKVSLLLDAVTAANMPTVRYIPLDINRGVIENSAKNLIGRFPGLRVIGMVADFEKQLHLIPGDAERLICFFGSTVGNLSRMHAMKIIAELGGGMRPGDRLLLGVDRVKNRDVLYKAYNDSRDTTARFNRNILNVINNLAGTNFNPDLFDHIAFYEEEHSRIEMHLKAVQYMEVSCPYLHGSIRIKPDETIHTENSHKFTARHIENLASAAGLKIEHIFSDQKQWFSLVQFLKTDRSDR